jgi:hypothetical protein
VCGQLYPQERAFGTHWIEGWLGPRARLDDMEKRKFLTLPGLELRPLSPAHSQSLYRLRCPDLWSKYLKEIALEDVNGLGQGPVTRYCEHRNEPSGFRVKDDIFLTRWETVSFLRRSLIHGVSLLLLLLLPKVYEFTYLLVSCALRSRGLFFFFL